MIKVLPVTIAILLITIPAVSQEKSHPVVQKGIFEILCDSSDVYGEVNINQDEFIKQLVNQHIEQNKNQRGIPGFRINIFFDSGYDNEGIDARTRAGAVKDTFDIYYPSIASYFIYEEPNYKVYVGDFRTRTDALKVFKRIRRRYPKAFIVNDRINYFRLD